ncbi:MAG: glycosyltransferase family 2 protein [Thermoanaerobaculia bacterium]
MRVDVVIVTWNGREDTLRAVEGVVSQSRPRSISELGIIVVDNGSTDGTGKALAANHPSVRVIRLGRNRGFTGGVRAGVEVSGAELVILLNNDAVPQPGWLEALTEAIAQAPDDVLSVAGCIVDPSGKRADFIRGAMTFDGHAFQPGFRKPLASLEILPAGTEIPFACGGNMIVRRVPFLAIGGFDDDYFAYLEDVDFGWRSWLAGYRTLWEPRAVVRHRSSATSDRLGSFERGVLFERNAMQTAIKNYDRESFRSVAGAIFLTALHRSHRYTIDRNPGTARLRRPALDQSPIEPSPAGGLAARIARRLGFRLASKTPVLDDELTVMQFRAIEWLFANSTRVMEKRRRVQALRKRPDREIFEHFPLLLVPTYHGDAQLFDSELFAELVDGLGLERRTLDDILG